MKTTPQDLKNLLDTYSGGSDGRYRHWARKQFIFTEGVKAMADLAGAHWLLDIVATEVAGLALRRWFESDDPRSYLQVAVLDSKATLTWVRDEGEPALWTREIEFTDFPEGTWTFELAIDGLLDERGDVLVMLLLQEH